MEFYDNKYLPPTLSIRVSIPNGMEFYLKNNFLSRDMSGFNSQRDGILLNTLKEQYPENLRFNSQRDGILQISAD